MNSVAFTAILWSTIPIVSLVASGLLAYRYQPREMLRSIILHFAAGVVFSVVSVELLPDVVKRHQPIEIAIGFGLGVIVMLMIRAHAERREKESDQSRAALPMGFVVGIGVDILVDGLLLGTVFAAGVKTGLLLAIALSIELVSLGLALGAEFSQRKVTFGRSVGILSAMAAAFVVGTVGSALFASRLSDEALELVLSFGLAALLFLVTEELLVEAHEEKEGPLQAGSFFGGFLLFLILGMLV